MRTCCRLLLALLLFGPLPAFAIGASWPLADTPRFWILGEGLGHFAADATYFQSHENYDTEGQVTTPSTLDRLSYWNLKLHGAFGFAPKLSLFAQIDIRELTQSGANAENNLGPGDAFLAFRWLAYRSSPTDRIYPTEWSPHTLLMLFEGSWNFPTYDKARNGKPPLGDQSNDFTGLGRFAWYTNEWLTFSWAAGYTYRTAGYSNGIPWNIRADLSFQEAKSMRYWARLQSFERVKNSAVVYNSAQPDPIPNGSLLFKSYAPVLRTADIGAGYLLGKEWEVLANFFLTASGVNHAKGLGGGLGITWRPYQVPEIKYDEYRQYQIARLQNDRKEYRKTNVAKYGYRATVVKVSLRGNYAKILLGEHNKAEKGDTFYILPPDDLKSTARRPVAFATVSQVQNGAAFLHIDERYFEKVHVQEGYEAIRVYFESDD
ncbi:MAG TPA: hypothetical protein VIH99_10940 [Bdellovibrionota bacterium]|jgi:hypothetical protein